MKISYAAIFTGIIVLIATLYTFFLLDLGLSTHSVLLPRKSWLMDNLAIWSLGWWLWMVSIFSWMLLLVTLMWSYIPAHRVSTILQSGLVLISATLVMAGIIAWMAVLPTAIKQPDPAPFVALTDMFALGLIGAGLFMGGIVTAWLCITLIQLKHLTWIWVAPGVLAGLCAIPSPFLLPFPYLLMVGALFWVGWSILLASRREFPKAFSEWL